MSPVLHVSGMETIEGKAPAVDQNNRIVGLAFKFKVEDKTASYTCLAEDSGKVFTNKGATGAVTFTLPALSAVEKGWNASFINVVDQNLVITPPTADLDKVVADGDATADTLTSSTTSHKIGAAVQVIAGDDQWLVFMAGNLSAVWTVATA
jgi:hypothetical protein